MRQHLAAFVTAAVITMPCLAWPAAAQIKIGVTISMTGPAASLGIPQRNSIELLPKGIGSTGIEYIVLDDGSDPARAVANARKLIDEDKVDAVVGSSTAGTAMAILGLAAEKQVPVVSLAASAAQILPMNPQRRWVFKTPQSDSLMADAIALHMYRAGVRTISLICYSDASGDGWFKETNRAMAEMTIKVVAIERFARADTDVTAQVEKMVAAKPDAVLIAASGTPAALPQKTLRAQGYAGKYYQTHGAASMDFIRAGGKDVEGTLMPVGPLLVASQLPDDNPSKSVAQEYVQSYEAIHGAGTVSVFGAYAYDAMVMVKTALPVALLTAKPGTPEFRAALRKGLEEAYGLVLTNGVAEMTAEDHSGFDKRARVMVTIQDGTWKLLP